MSAPKNLWVLTYSAAAKHFCNIDATWCERDFFKNWWLLRCPYSIRYDPISSDMPLTPARRTSFENRGNICSLQLNMWRRNMSVKGNRNDTDASGRISGHWWSHSFFQRQTQRVTCQETRELCSSILRQPHKMHCSSIEVGLVLSAKPRSSGEIIKMD